MTKSEFIDKYGKIEVTFSSYYKYTFTYCAVLEDGTEISVSVGGDSDEIYRMEVCSDDKQTIEQLDPYRGSVYSDGIEVEYFNDY